MADLRAIHHVALTVSDLDTSIAWYQRVFGFEELFREPGEIRRACVMRNPGGSFVLGLVEHAATGDEAFDPVRVGLDHVAFTVDSMEEMAVWADRLTAAGIDHSGTIDVPPGAILNLKDPDGIALSLFWDRPGT